MFHSVNSYWLKKSDDHEDRKYSPEASCRVFREVPLASNSKTCRKCSGQSSPPILGSNRHRCSFPVRCSGPFAYRSDPEEPTRWRTEMIFWRINLTFLSLFLSLTLYSISLSLSLFFHLYPMCPTATYQKYQHNHNFRGLRCAVEVHRVGHTDVDVSLNGQEHS